jgi:PilZ domain
MLPQRAPCGEESDMTDDRRAFARHHVHKNGKIIFMDQPFFVECTIRNISEDGALLSMLVSVPLPQDILLWEEKTGRLFECSIRWRRDHMVGVHFTDVCGRATRHAMLERCFAPLTCSLEPSSMTH